MADDKNKVSPTIMEAIESGLRRAHPIVEADSRFRESQLARSEAFKKSVTEIVQGLDALKTMGKISYSVVLEKGEHTIKTNIPTDKKSHNNMNIMVKDDGKFKVYLENKGERETLHKGDIKSAIAFITEKAAVAGLVKIPESFAERIEASKKTNRHGRG